jgi:hypothetical protein
MNALYELGGHMVALNRIITIGPVETIGPKIHKDKVYAFDLNLNGAHQPHRHAGLDCITIRKTRADLIDAVNLFFASPEPQDENQCPGPIVGLTTGECCLIYRRRAGLSLGATGAQAWPDLKAVHQKLKKIETGQQIPTQNDLERLAEVLGAPELARIA